MTGLSSPLVSVVVPVINEAAVLPALFASLARQRGVAMEIIISDGGSTDGTIEKVGTLAEAAPFPVVTVCSAPGRGRQLNAGAAAARGEMLLFLHADSSFPDPDALASALARLDREPETAAGHFPLVFQRTTATPSFAYFYYEAKARLGRKECIHGDHGFLLRPSLFLMAGRFEEGVPFGEDTGFAERVRGLGRWILLPSVITTSARRFETEGFKERQILNAMIMNLAALGMHPLLAELPDLYRRQDRSRRLDLLPFLERIAAYLRQLAFRERLRFWYETGTYVRNNAWQLAFAADAWAAFARGKECRSRCLDLHDRFFNRITDHPPGRAAAGALTWLWFRLTRAMWTTTSE